MLLEEFDYALPTELIAQRPLDERDASRMMLLDRAARQWEDRIFGEISQLLQPDDLLVFNNTKVFPARLLGRRRGITAQPMGKNNPAQRGFLTGETELLLTRQESDDVWQGLVHPGRKVRTGEVLVFGEDELEAEILGRGEYGVRRVRLRARTGTIEEALDRLGHVPLPPYIHRGDEASDRATYQTVYAKVRGAVAAPTAGLHFTPPGFERACGAWHGDLRNHPARGTRNFSAGRGKCKLKTIRWKPKATRFPKPRRQRSTGPSISDAESSQ